MRVSFKGMAFLAALALAAALAPDAVAGGVEQRYPPYPDVWGRRLDVPLDVYLNPAVYVMDDGGRRIMYSWFTDPHLKEREARWMDFFTGETGSLTEAEDEAAYQAQIRKLGGAAPEYMRGVPIVPIRTEKGVVEGWVPQWSEFEQRGTYPRAATCQVGSYYWHKTERKNKTTYGEGRILVRLLKRPVEEEVPYDCQRYTSRKTFLFKVDFWGVGVVRTQLLEDGTFLGTFGASVTREPERHVIRFDKNFRSPYVDAHPELMVVDYDEEIAPVLKDARAKAESDPNFDVMQYVQDEVYERLKTRK